MIYLSNAWKQHSHYVEECYTFEVEPFTLKDLIRDISWYVSLFGDKSGMIPHDARTSTYILNGYVLGTGSDPHVMKIPIALGDSAEELNVFMDLNCHVHEHQLTKTPAFDIIQLSNKGEQR